MEGGVCGARSVWSKECGVKSMCGARGVWMCVEQGVCGVKSVWSKECVEQGVLLRKNYL